MLDHCRARSDEGVAVLVVGDLMLDRYTKGSVGRVSPEAPVPVVLRESETATAGGAGNAASNVAALGERVAIIGAVGDDPAAAALRTALAEAGIDASGAITTESPTIVKHRIVAAGQQIVRVDVEPSERLGALAIDQLLRRFRARLDATKVVLVSDYAKGVCTPELCREVIDLAVAAGKPVIVDPKSDDFSSYAGATIITPNVIEARKAITDRYATIDEVGAALVKVARGCILITQGSEGMTLYSPTEEPVHLPAKAVHVYDVTGAGDTVAATLAVGLSRGLPVTQACHAANEAAAIAVSRRGTTVVTEGDLVAARSGVAR